MSDRKPPSERTNRNKPKAPDRQVERVPGKIYGEALVGDHNSAVLNWWLSVRKAPVAAQFEEYDWEHLRLAAYILDKIYDSGTRPSTLPGLVASFQSIIKGYGLSMQDALKHGIEVVEPLTDLPKIDYRKRLGEVSG